MDTDRQIRLDFLEEADKYFHSLESLLIDLDSQGAEPKLLDSAMRAAHSLKGGAAMMRFPALSRIAHRLEDFLKILRVRKDSSLIDREVTTLLLKSVDCLRTVRNLHQRDVEIDRAWFAQNTEPVFEGLQARLGDLKEEDENLLLAEEEQVDVSVLIFQSGVEDCLENFEAQINVLEPTRLKKELAVCAQRLKDIGQMSLIEPFVELCESVIEQLAVVSIEDIAALANKALKQWERSQALVLVGRIDKLPNHIDSKVSSLTMVENGNSTPDITGLVDAAELNKIQNFTARELAGELSLTQFESKLDEFSLDERELLEIDAALAEEFSPIEEAEELPESKDTFAQTDTLKAEGNSVSQPIALASLTPSPVSQQEPERMIRVSAQRLQSINNLSSKLILERNAAILRLNQLQNYVALTKERMRRLEQSNNRLQQLYNRTSEKTIFAAQSKVVSDDNRSEVSHASAKKFDSLEMDRYTDLHLLSHEQMETIVQLQEVTADIDLGVRDMKQVIGDFSHTIQELQQNTTRSQMRPFSELVNRFPRLIRDLSTQHDKKVELVIEGKTTYIDRQALELLIDPLTQLLRNAFAHGLEDVPTRIKAGKNPQGTILLKATQQGDRTKIIVRDDGGGIDTQRIRDRLLKLGFSQSQVDRISKTDVLKAIFEPGFSTATQITELSGRGVGMDVVRSNLQQIRGDIRVDTELGKGTTFTISVPLSLLVIRVVIVESAGIVFAVPINSIREIIKYSPESTVRQGDRERIIWGKKSILLIRLAESFKFQRPSKPFEMGGSPKIERPTILVFEENSKLQGIYLEKYWKEQEVSIRPVKTPIPLFPGFEGSIILGDGRVIPLIEPGALSQGIERQQAEFFSPTSLSTKDVFNSSSLVRNISTILIVDDSVNVRRYLAKILERNGYWVEEAIDGRDAVDKLLEGLQVDVIICDLEMPRLDGYGVLSEVKSEPKLKHILIAILTSRSSNKHRQLAMKLGASAYFSKPFNEREMLQTLASLVSKS